jgi:hypothetical protein
MANWRASSMRPAIAFAALHHPIARVDPGVGVARRREGVVGGRT